VTSQNIIIEKNTIHYRIRGSGPIPLICFHGYGESSSRFDFLESNLQSHFTIIAIDLPHHGQTEWTNPQTSLSTIITTLLQNLNLQSTNIHLLGFSLGGRIALSLLQEMPASISKLVLLAPDGLTVNFWYWLSTQTSIGNSLFKLTMKKPGWFLGMLRISNKLRLINQSIYKFVEHYIHDDQVRKDLYHRWTGLRKYKPNKKKLKQIIAQNNISISLLYGKFDRIIGNEKGERFIKGLPKANIQVLNCGHQVLHEKNTAAIVSALLH